MDLLGYYVAMGQIEKVKEVAKHVPDKRSVEKLKYEDADKVLRELTRGQGLDAVNMFKSIGQLKNGIDELDLNYIFWINCREINNEPSCFHDIRFGTSTGIKNGPQRYKIINQAQWWRNMHTYMECIQELRGMLHLHCGLTTQGCTS